MAKKVRNKQSLDTIAAPRVELRPEAKKSLALVLLLVLGVFSLLGLFNLSGALGNFLSRILTLGFGYGKLFVPVLILVWAFFLYRGRAHHISVFNYLGLFLFFFSLEAIFHWFITPINWELAVQLGYGGGYLGLFLAKICTSAFGFWGGLIILCGFFLISLILIFNTNLASFITPIIQMFKNSGKDDGAYSVNEMSGNINPVLEIPVLTEENLAKEETESLRAKALSIFKERKIKVAVPIEKPELAKTKLIKIDIPLELLSAKTGQAQGGDIEHNSVVIKRTLENFGIPVEMGFTSVGPTVTQYTFKPCEGIKVSRITALNNDLSLALAAHPLRIEAPIPGKALVGIEVPNKIKALVGLRAMLEDKQFKDRSNNMLAALGKDVSGLNWFYDICKMPHLLVAGATNSGKSVCLNTIIVSLLYQNDPSNLRFIMVDPKRVELPAYNGIPHLLTPVITEINKTINALKWCMNEMDRRYDVLNKTGQKNIQSYNIGRAEKMPYIVFVIDELADLMVAAARDIESSIIRLTQMSRAVGIHLILATQRPSVDVITGLIKANIPARIAFSVASAIDSKTILDCSGAEKLLGRGDMLFSAAEMSKPKRLQGAFVSDEEINRITAYIKENSGEAEYTEGITERQKVNGISGVGLDGIVGDEDELFEEAKDAIVAAGRASTSLLQRRLRIGYGRAASILDALEEAGLIGPPNGSKPRELLISKEEYLNMTALPASGMPLHKRAESSAPDTYLDDAEGDDGTLEFEPEEKKPEPRIFDDEDGGMLFSK